MDGRRTLCADGISHHRGFFWEDGREYPTVKRVMEGMPNSETGVTVSGSCLTVRSATARSSVGNLLLSLCAGPRYTGRQNRGVPGEARLGYVHGVVWLPWYTWSMVGVSHLGTSLPYTREVSFQQVSPSPIYPGGVFSAGFLLSHTSQGGLFPA